MSEAQWRASKSPLDLYHHRQVAKKHRERRLVVCAVARRLLPLLGHDARAVALLDAVERYADAGEANGPARWKAVLAARRGVRKFIDEVVSAPGPARRAHALRAAYWVSEASINEAGPAFGLAVMATEGPSLTPGLTETLAQLAICHCVFGNPFRPVSFLPAWRTDTTLALARQMYESRDFSAMPILADALQDAGCDSPDILSHCREPGQHVRGCWAVDLVLGKA